MLPDFRVRQRDYLLEIARALTQELDQDKLLRRILQLSAEMLAGQAGLIALRGEDGGWRLVVSHGISDQLLKYLDALLAQLPETQNPAHFELPEVNRILQQIARRASLGLLTGVGLPLIARNQVIGVIFVFRSTQGGFSDNDYILLQSFADQAAVAVANARLYTQLRHEKQRMSALLDTAADGILIMKPDHQIEHVNPAFARLWGRPSEALIGLNHDDVVRWTKLAHGITLEKAEAGGWPLSAQATLYVEGDLLKMDGATMPIGMTYAALLSEEGALVNIIASARDITHFRQAEDLKRTFVSVISHELKTPVALIKGYVSTLRREDARWDRKIVDDSLAVIEDETDRLAELIENLLDATRLEAGVLSLNATDLALPALAKRLAERFQTQTGKHPIRTDFPDDFPIVLADEDRISQVLYNLIGNGVKYSPEGGEICISGEVRPEQVVVCVRDHGKGIATGDLPHVFDRFYRADDAQRKTSGAGLGLYLARAVIEAHRGNIWVDPTVKDGARICFSLPRPDEA
ncbi:MAG: PAS domain-containing protein [Anaerolineae bacterium]|nr:MAG: PAS domain-containing protein [Anaerolineae bacterium]